MTEKTSAEKTLRECREGDRVRVVAVGGQGAFRLRLMEMGFVPGAEVFVQKYAPLRDPIEFVVKSYHVSLRREEASLVAIEAADAAANE